MRSWYCGCGHTRWCARVYIALWCIIAQSSELSREWIGDKQNENSIDPFSFRLTSSKEIYKLWCTSASRMTFNPPFPFQKLCLGDYKFEVILESYANPSHKLADGTCCNRPNRYRCGQRAVCNNLFTFCVRPYGYGSAAKTSKSCAKSGASYTTSVIADDNISFKEAQHLNFVTNMSNPLVFYGKVWPVRNIVFSESFNTVSRYDNWFCWSQFIWHPAGANTTLYTSLQLGYVWKSTNWQYPSDVEPTC